MNLAELEPEFLRITNDDGSFRRCAGIAEADGVWFLCPKCFTANSGPIGTHRVLCWRPRVPQTIGPTPGRWELEGSGLSDLSLVAGSSSVALTSAYGGCAAHFFVRSGRIEMA